MIPINILLIDDHLLFSQSLAIAFEDKEEIKNFYTTNNIDSINNILTNVEIDILLVDINLGKLQCDGLSLAGKLKKEFNALKIVILTGYDLPVYKHEAKKLGLNGFLNKNISPDLLLKSLIKVNTGASCFSSGNDAEVVEELTKTEQEILTLLSRGGKRKEIARALFISERTLSNHLQHIYEKLEVSSSVEAVTKSAQMGYIKPIL